MRKHKEEGPIASKYCFEENALKFPNIYEPWELKGTNVLFLRKNTSQLFIPYNNYYFNQNCG